MKPFTFHCDPGHGWLAVPYEMLVNLNCHQDISSFSYRAIDSDFIDMAYLEEDCDANTFRTAFLHRWDGKEPEYVEAFTNDYSFIRELPRYK